MSSAPKLPSNPGSQTPGGPRGSAGPGDASIVGRIMPATGEMMPEAMHDAPGECRLNFDQLKLDRRRCPRKVCEELVTAVFHADAPATHAELGLTRLLLRDISHTGLGCLSEKPLEPGTKLTLTTHGVPMPHKAGTVIRCTITTEGYLLGLTWDRTRDMAK
ncbi:MAG: PilZ domain-containing protein [Phycisphaerales bacterium]|nr:PilZ domain-containing protein [Phycisphaerales bacterium]